MNLQTQFFGHITRAIKERRAAIVESLASASGIPDYAAYTKQVGYLAALADIEAEAEKIDTQIRGG